MALTRAKGKRPYIVTNGIRLADSGYLANLVRKGLHGVSLSVNALDREILRKVDGADYLDAKLAAVVNLKRYLRRFSICFTLIPNVNDTEFGKVLRFALGQYPFARSFRAECLPGIGRSFQHEGVCLSEFLNLFAAHSGIHRHRLVELASQGRASLGPYGYGGDYRDLMFDCLRNGSSSSGSLWQRFMSATRDSGLVPLAIMVASRAFRVSRLRMGIHLISGPLPDTVDLQETSSARTTMTISRESPELELWEYLIRYHGTSHAVSAKTTQNGRQ